MEECRMQGNHTDTVPDIRQTVELKAPIQKVWDAVATHEGISAWFMPNDFQPVVGHEFVIRSPYGESPCKVTKLDAPNELSFTWGENWVITFELEDLGEKTKLTLTHSGWIKGFTEHTGEEHTVIRNRMDQGWGSSVLPSLVKYVEG
jgi:uncharacterized protein YndB with AHSA1/START domain